MRRLAVFLTMAVLLACGGGEPAPHFPGVFVLGFDGMEPTIVEREMAAGKLPNFKRLAELGTYSHVATTLPPESPVAWASFLTGMNPGGHGIFDFIHHRIDPRGGIRLHLSTAETTGPSCFVPFFGYRIPLRAGETRLLVKGRYFYEDLAERGIPVSVVRVPSNYPPREMAGRSFPGMGTPDLLGSYGVFSLFTESPPLRSGQLTDTAHVMPVEVRGGRAESVLRGPRNVYVAEEGELAPYATVPVVIYPDRERGVARVDVGERKVVLAVGDWSDWVPVRFPLIPGVASASGIVRLYLQSVAPHLSLYASPVNLDPLAPEVQLSTPEKAAPELARRIGRFYTQGMAEDTQAHRHDILDLGEFLEQSELVLEERRRMLDVELERFRKLGGFTFVYFSTTDLCAHMLFRTLDPENPRYDEAEAKQYGGKLVEIYQEMDRILGQVLDETPAGTCVVALSDHGFKSLRRTMNLNTWLFEQGYLALRYPERQGDFDNYRNVDWIETRAYAVGFSGICLNLAGREVPGRVTPGEEAERLRAEIVAKLEALVDPETGKHPVTKVYRREEAYSGAAVEEAPDLVVGFNLHYGCDDASATGTVSRRLLADVPDAWSGSHLMDPSHVPGILLVNRRLVVPDPGLWDLAASILLEFGLPFESPESRKLWPVGK